MSSGSDISSLDQFRQGVYTRGSFERRGALPILGPEIGSFYVTASIFGQPKTYSDETSFTDQARFDVVTWINDASGTNVYPAVLGNVNIRDPFQMDGVIEPLSIRGKVGFTSIDYPIESHDIKGTLQGGSEDLYDLSTRLVSQFLPIVPISDALPYLESGEEWGATVTGSVTYYMKIPGAMSDATLEAPAFSDRDDAVYSLHGVTLTGTDVINVIIGMNPDDEDLIPLNSKAAGSGFTYDNSPMGTDSLAFGGFKL